MAGLRAIAASIFSHALWEKSSWIGIQLQATTRNAYPLTNAPQPDCFGLRDRVNFVIYYFGCLHVESDLHRDRIVFGILF